MRLQLSPLFAITYQQPREKPQLFTLGFRQFETSQQPLTEAVGVEATSWAVSTSPD